MAGINNPAGDNESGPRMGARVMAHGGASAGGQFGRRVGEYASGRTDLRAPNGLRCDFDRRYTRRSRAVYPTHNMSLIAGRATLLAKRNLNHVIYRQQKHSRRVFFVRRWYFSRLAGAIVRPQVDELTRESIKQAVNLISVVVNDSRA